MCGVTFANPASTVCNATARKRTRYAYTSATMVPVNSNPGFTPNAVSIPPAIQLSSRPSGTSTPIAITAPGMA